MLACECGYNTLDRSNFKRHRKTCRSIRDSEVENLRSELSRTRQRLESRDLELSRCRKKIARLETCVARLKSTSGKTTVRDCNIFVTNIFPYASEPSVVTPEQVDSILSTVTPSESVPRFIQLKHFSGPLAARNIYLPNRRGNTVLVVEASDDGRMRWVHRDRKGVIDDMLERNITELRTNYRADRVIPWHQWLRTSGLLGVQRRSTPAWKEQLAKLDLILVNHQRVPRSIDTTMRYVDTDAHSGTDDE